MNVTPECARTTVLHAAGRLDNTDCYYLEDQRAVTRPEGSFTQCWAPSGGSDYDSSETAQEARNSRVPKNMTACKSLSLVTRHPRGVPE